VEGWLSGPSFIACPKPPGVVPNVCTSCWQLLLASSATYCAFVSARQAVAKQSWISPSQHQFESGSTFDSTKPDLHGIVWAIRLISSALGQVRSHETTVTVGSLATGGGVPHGVWTVVAAHWGCFGPAGGEARRARQCTLCHSWHAHYRAPTICSMSPLTVMPCGWQPLPSQNMHFARSSHSLTRTLLCSLAVPAGLTYSKTVGRIICEKAQQLPADHIYIGGSSHPRSHIGELLSSLVMTYVKHHSKVPLTVVVQGAPGKSPQAVTTS